jgi:hypothetical protein
MRYCPDPSEPKPDSSFVLLHRQGRRRSKRPRRVFQEEIDGRTEQWAVRGHSRNAKTRV